MNGEADALVRSLMDNFRRIVRALRSSHRAAGNLALTGAQLFILKVLGENDRSMSISELAQLTETTQSTASVVTARLVERGLLTSERSANDARRVELSLTPRGRAVFRKTPATVAQVRLAEALKDLPLRDATKLDELLAVIVEKMGLGAEPPGMLFDDPDAAQTTKSSKHTEPRHRRTA